MEILIIILLLFLVLKFVGKMIKGLISIVIVILLGVTVLYFVKPSVLEDFFGKENVEWVVGEVEDVADSVSVKVKTKIDSVRVN